MKKQAIRGAVEKAKEAYMPKAIKEEAEYRARDEVRQALQPEVVEEAKPTATQQEPSRSRVFQANDPILTGRQ